MPHHINFTVKHHTYDHTYIHKANPFISILTQMMLLFVWSMHSSIITSAKVIRFDMPPILQSGELYYCPRLLVWHHNTALLIGA